MNTLPLTQKFVAALYDFTEQTPHVRPLDAHAEDNVRHPVIAQKVDFSRPMTNDVDMRRFVIERLNNKAKPIRSADDDHDAI